MMHFNTILSPDCALINLEFNSGLSSCHKMLITPLVAMCDLYLITHLLTYQLIISNTVENSEVDNCNRIRTRTLSICGRITPSANTSRTWTYSSCVTPGAKASVRTRRRTAAFFSFQSRFSVSR